MIITSDKTLEEKCQALINCGRKEPGYDSFEGNLFGFNFRITEFQAALLSDQLDRLEEQRLRKETNLVYLSEQLQDLAPGLVPVKRDNRITHPACYQYIMRYDSSAFQGVHRDRFAQALGFEGVPCDPLFYTPIYRRGIFPLRASEYPQCRDRYGEDIGAAGLNCPVTEKAAYEEALWFHHPLFLGDRNDMDDIADAIRKVTENIWALKT